MSLDLKPEVEAVIREKVASGHYRDESDVVSEALALLDERDQRKLEWLRAKIAAGRKDFDEGRYTELRSDEEIDAFFESL
jgi:putative addiction module CopG family antidote